VGVHEEKRRGAGRNCPLKDVFKNMKLCKRSLKYT